MTESTKCTVFTPQTKPCGQFGTCYEAVDNSTFCVCREGYTQFGDFSPLADLPCDLNLAAVRGVWAVPAVFCFASLCLSVWAIIARLSTGTLQLRAWRVWSVPYFVFVYSILALGMCIGKFVDPEKWAIGISAGATVLHGFLILILVTGLIVGLAGIARTAYADSIRTLSAEDRVKMELKMKVIEVCIVFFWFMTILCSFIPCAMLTNSRSYRWAYGVQAIGMGFGILILGVIVAPMELGVLLERVQQSISANKDKQSFSAANSKMARIAWKLRIGKPMTLVVSSITTLFFFGFGGWPFMIPKASYTLPLMYSIGASAGTGLIWVTTTTSAIGARRPSQALKRLSQVLTNGRKSTDLNGRMRSRSSMESTSPTLGLVPSSSPIVEPSF